MHIKVIHMNDNIKVLQICSYYTGTKLYHKLFASLSALDVDENVYAFTSNSYKINESVNYDINVSNCYSRFDRMFFHLKHSKVFKDIESKYEIEKFDIMHAHSLFSNGYIAYKLNQKYHIPYIVAVRNTDVNLFFKKMIHLRKTGLKILKNANKIVFISEPYRKSTIHSYIPKKYMEDILRKAVVIPNGIDEFWLNNKNDYRTNTVKNEIKLIYVGSIDKNKNIDTTIKACEILLKKGYKICYTIVGDMVNKEYEKIISRNYFINYISFCEKEELINYYKQNDIFVMPSKHETFGLVYAEAMSQGLPVIYTRRQGFDGQFEDGEVGYSVDCMNPDDIADGIIKINENYNEISNNCIKLVDNFNWDRIALQYKALYSICIK